MPGRAGFQREKTQVGNEHGLFKEQRNFRVARP